MFCGFAKIELIISKKIKMSNYNDITTIIFDLGGVLVNLDWNKCINLGGVLVNLDWNKCIIGFSEIGIEEMSELLSTTLQRGFILDFEKGLISEDEFRNQLRKYSSKTLTDKQIDLAWSSFLVNIPAEKLELLWQLKQKYKILMLSNTNSLSYNFCVNTMFNTNGHTLDDYFDKCYLSYQMHLCKPEADIFEALLKDAGVKA
ncbi:MAG: HAD-superfamily hydrolase, subfamily variant 3, partial [Bacteroidetes bacterium]|nr:HAD-superfamily hydrolase, subfamily variant 3 [Bacteroidota bacterium]